MGDKNIQKGSMKITGEKSSCRAKREDLGENNSPGPSVKRRGQCKGIIPCHNHRTAYFVFELYYAAQPTRVASPGQEGKEFLHYYKFSYWSVYMNEAHIIF